MAKVEQPMRRCSKVSHPEPDGFHFTQISAVGQGLINGQTGEKCFFNVSNAPTGEDYPDDLSFEISGPSKPEVMINNNKDGSTEVSYVPLVPGDYTIKVRWRMNHITGSPFQVIITGQSIDATKLISKVKVYGKAIELGRACAINEFIVDCREMNPI